MKRRRFFIMKRAKSDKRGRTLFQFNISRNNRHYIASVSSNFVEIADYELILSSDFDCNTPGTYSVHFGVEDSAGRTGYSVLTVVVRG